MLTDFAIKNYRSVKDLWLRLDQVTVIVGANGCGKSNVYRALELIAKAAEGELANSIAEEGGYHSVKWSGPFSKFDKSLVSLSIRTESHQYDIDFTEVNSPRFNQPYFNNDIEIAGERLFKLQGSKKSKIFKRRRVSVEAGNASSGRADYTNMLDGNRPFISDIKDPQLYPALSELRSNLLRWRFYHRFRTDLGSPIRRPNLPVATLSLNEDGTNLTNAIATILEMGDREGFLTDFADAFPGTIVTVESKRSGLALKVKYKSMKRPMNIEELSEGTLKYLCLLAAFYSLEPPPFLAINEPENSLHEDLLEPLARLIVKVSEHSQIWLTTHSQLLADYILEYGGYQDLQLEKVEGETCLKGVGLAGYREEEDEEEEDAD